MTAHFVMSSEKPSDPHTTSGPERGKVEATKGEGLTAPTVSPSIETTQRQLCDLLTQNP